jgi:hypothetical protein
MSRITKLRRWSNLGAASSFLRFLERYELASNGWMFSEKTGDPVFAQADRNDNYFALIVLPIVLSMTAQKTFSFLSSRIIQSANPPITLIVGNGWCARPKHSAYAPKTSSTTMERSEGMSRLAKLSLKPRMGLIEYRFSFIRTLSTTSNLNREIGRHFHSPMLPLFIC